MIYCKERNLNDVYCKNVAQDDKHLFHLFMQLSELILHLLNKSEFWAS